MNTKFDVGQRVTYPIVTTSDGEITGITVGKDGIAHYGIGNKFYTESDLKLAAEAKPDAAITATVPSAESKPGPVKLYCVKSFMYFLSVGKIYESDEAGHITYDDGRKSRFPISDPRFDFVKIGNLAPLVSRPAKAGEWVLPLADCPFGRYKRNQLLKVTKDLSNNPGSVFYNNGVVYEHPDCNAYVIRNEEYLVLDDYHGDLE